MQQMEIEFEPTEGGITLEELEQNYYPDPDAIVKRLAESDGALDLFQDEQPEAIDPDELSKYISMQCD